MYLPGVVLSRIRLMRITRDTCRPRSRAAQGPLKERSGPPVDRSASARHHHDPDDSFVVQRQAHRKVPLIRHFAGFTPASDLVRTGNDVAVDVLELRLPLFHGELLVSARLLKHSPARHDASKGVARRHGLDIGIEQLVRRLEIMRRDSFEKPTCAGELHGRDVAPANTIFKLARWSHGARRGQSLGTGNELGPGGKGRALRLPEGVITRAVTKCPTFVAPCATWARVTRGSLVVGVRGYDAPPAGSPLSRLGGGRGGPPASVVAPSTQWEPGSRRGRLTRRPGT